MLINQAWSLAALALRGGAPMAVTGAEGRLGSQGMEGLESPLSR